MIRLGAGMVVNKEIDRVAELEKLPGLRVEKLSLKEVNLKLKHTQ